MSPMPHPSPTPPPSPPTPPMHLGGLQRSPCSRLAMSHKCRIRLPDTAYQPHTAAAAAAAYIRPYQADTTLIRRISTFPDACLMPQPDIRPVCPLGDGATPAHCCSTARATAACCRTATSVPSRTPRQTSRRAQTRGTTVLSHGPRCTAPDQRPQHWAFGPVVPRQHTSTLTNFYTTTTLSGVSYKCAKYTR